MNYPVDLDAVWRELKYASKQRVVDVLKRNFVEGDDYIFGSGKFTTKKGGRPKLKIFLTEECFQKLRAFERVVCPSDLIRDLLAQAECGEKLVPTPVGRVDVVTKKSIILIHPSSRWCEGIGQLLVYAGYFPERKLQLYFYDQPENPGLIHEHARRLGVEINIWGK